MELTEAEKARFWSHVDKRGPDECWPWTGKFDAVGKRAQGYGRWTCRRKNFGATHISLLLSGRPRPDGMVARHSCRNRLCVNPAHLSWGTHRDNMLDAVESGTIRKILAPDEVRLIRSDTRTDVELAAELDVSPSTVSFARRGLYHKDVA